MVSHRDESTATEANAEIRIKETATRSRGRFRRQVVRKKSEGKIQNRDRRFEKCSQIANSGHQSR